MDCTYLHFKVDPLLYILAISLAPPMAYVVCFSMVPFFKVQSPVMVVPGDTPTEPLDMTVSTELNATEV